MAVIKVVTDLRKRNIKVTIVMALSRVSSWPWWGPWWSLWRISPKLLHQHGHSDEGKAPRGMVIGVTKLKGNLSIVLMITPLITRVIKLKRVKLSVIMGVMRWQVWYTCTSWAWSSLCYFGQSKNLYFATFKHFWIQFLYILLCFQLILAIP